MPNPRDGCVAVVVSDCEYAIGGIGYGDNFEIGRVVDS